MTCTILPAPSFPRRRKRVIFHGVLGSRGVPTVRRNVPARCRLLSQTGLGDAMELPRRFFLQLVAGAAALPALSRFAWVEAWPTRPVHWIISFPPGGANDIVARIIGQHLSDDLGQQFVIENKAGAGGNIGMQSALSAAGDGYTIA